ncbi:Acyl-CoA-binding domain-containing protein 5 [Podila epicladia]|nr:Acyl-CoA-binding domain-containing protein 5 [Podila epicladia]
MNNVSKRTVPPLLRSLLVAISYSSFLSSCFSPYSLTSAQTTSFTPTIVRGSWSTFVEGKALYVSGGWTPPDDSGYAQTFSIDLSRPWDARTPTVTSLDHTGAPVDIMLPSALMGDNNTWLVLSRGMVYKYSIHDNKWQSAGAVPNMFPTQNRTLAGDIDPETGVWYIPNGYNVASTGSSTIVSMMQLNIARNLASGITGANGPPNDLARFSAVWSKRLKQLLVFGGESAAPTGVSGRTMSSNLYTFSPASNTWSVPQPQGVVPTPRCSHCFVPAFNGTKMVLFGGWGDYSRTIAYSDIYILDLETWTWTKGPDVGASAIYGRGMSACAVSGDLFVSWGGGVGTAAIVAQNTTTLLYNLTSQQWVSRYEPPPYSTPSSPPPSSANTGDTGSSSLPIAAIAGGAAGGAVVLLATIALIIRRRRRQHQSRDQDDDGTFSPPGTGDNFSLINRPGNPYSNVKAELTAPDDQRHSSSSNSTHPSYPTSYPPYPSPAYSPMHQEHSSVHQGYPTLQPVYPKHTPKDARSPQLIPYVKKENSPRAPHSETLSNTTIPAHDLANIALSLGLSDEGVREDLVARIKSHIAKHGASDSALREFLYEDERNSTESSKLANLSSASEDDLSDTAAQVRVTRSSPRRNTAVTSARTASDSDSAEDPLSEHRVQKFMEHVHEDLEDAKDLAHSVEHTLQRKYRSGKESLRRASKDLTSSVTEAIGGVVGHRHDGGRHRHHEESSWCSTILSELKYHMGCSSGHFGLSAWWTDAWKKIHDLGSTSSGFVWITFLFELAVFLFSAFSRYSYEDHDGWVSSLRLFSDWKSTFQRGPIPQMS